MADNVYSSAKIVSQDEGIQKYELGSFVNTKPETPEFQTTNVILDSTGMNGKTDVILDEIKNLTMKLNDISQKVTNIETNGIKPKDVDAQVIQAIKDLKHYAAFFEQATFQMETKLLKPPIVTGKQIGRAHD